MKIKFGLFFAVFYALCCSSAEAQTTIQIFDEVKYFDGYAPLVSDPLPAGVLRLRNDLITRKITQAELQTVGTELVIQVVIHALCDNYDRIGSVSLAFVPKGASTYSPDSVSHIEVGRFITPFMNKNIQPDTVPYSFTVNNIASVLKESSLNADFDFWVELEVFGVPYAANNEVAGCAGRNDVFLGSVKFITSGSTESQSSNFLLPVSFKKDFNNYNANATDILGQTTRTFQVNIPQDLSDVSFYLITSNHGANAGGEEYNRRQHYVYIDGALALQYKPGSLTCEPFRVYNTQGNGIYGPNPRTNAQWQSFSNWCPGDVIPIRTISLDSLHAGNHSFQIEVPQAVFNGGQGNIPLSLYVQGKSTVLGINEAFGGDEKTFIYPNPVNTVLHIGSSQELEQAAIFNVCGQKLMESKGKDIDVSNLSSGVYVVRAQLSTNKVEILRMIKN